MDRSSQGEEGMGLYKPCGIGFDLALYEPYRCNKLNVVGHVHLWPIKVIMQHVICLMFPKMSPSWTSLTSNNSHK